MRYYGGDVCPACEFPQCEVQPCTARTPDGARYTHKAVRAALAGLME